MTPVNEHIRNLKAYEPGLQPGEGQQVIKLNTNENPYPPSPWVLEAIRDEASGDLRLYPDPPSRRLRETAASLYGLEPDQVLCGNGSDELLGILLRTFASRGDRIGYYHPSYSYYATLGALHALEPVPIPIPDPRADPALPETRGLAIFFLTNPNSPLGFSLRPEFVETIARDMNGILVLDEAYADFARWNCIALLRHHPNVVITRTLSKSYSLAGLRVGLAFAGREIVTQMDKVRDHYNLNRIAQLAACVALRDRGFFEENRRRVLQTRERVRTALEGLGLQPLSSEANFLFVRFGSAEHAARIYRKLLDGGILVRYFDADGLRDGLRITVGTDREMDRLLDALRAAL